MSSSNAFTLGGRATSTTAGAEGAEAVVCAWWWAAVEGGCWAIAISSRREVAASRRFRRVEREPTPDEGMAADMERGGAGVVSCC